MLLQANYKNNLAKVAFSMNDNATTLFEQMRIAFALLFYVFLVQLEEIGIFLQRTTTVLK